MRPATRRPLRTLVAALAVSVSLTSTPAHADTTVVDDGADTAASRTDILRVRVVHTDRPVQVKVGFPTCASGPTPA